MKVRVAVSPGWIGISRRVAGEECQGDCGRVVWGGDAKLVIG